MSDVMTIQRHQPATRDRAMRPEDVAAEIMDRAKDREYVIRAVPHWCRWQGPRTRPPLFSEQRTRAWWNGERRSA